MVPPKKTTGNVANGSGKTFQNMSFQKKDGSTGPGKGNSASFRTDTAISAGRPGGERVLQRWQPDSNDTYDYSLEGPSSNNNNNGNKPPVWDQFAENERRFGIKSDYDEGYYTTQINKSAPDYDKKKVYADQKAQEIERSVASSSHIAEERIMDYVPGGNDGKEDEEDKYSGVRRQDAQGNKYTPPARRAPQSNSTVKGAPVDPAIISSQLRAPKNQAGAKENDTAELASPPAAKTPEAKPESTAVSSQPKSAETKPSGQNLGVKPSGSSSRAISPQPKDANTPSATSTVERDVLTSFKDFAQQQRQNAEKQRSSKAKADKQVKLHELKKFASSFKLPTPVPVDLISIIAKDPDKQKKIQEKAQRDVTELQKKKLADEATPKDKTPAARDGQATATTQAPADTRGTRNAPPGAPAAVPSGGQGRSSRHQSYVPGPHYPGSQGYRPNPSQMPQGRGLGNRIRNNIENRQSVNNGPDVRQAPTGPANPMAQFNHARLSGAPSHMSPAKLNPNSNEFRPTFPPQPFNPNGHISTTSSPRSAANTGQESHASTAPSGSAMVTPITVITKKKNAVQPSKCNILSHIRAQQPPQKKDWSENGNLRPSYDTPPVWRSQAEPESCESMTMNLKAWFEKRPFTAQPTPNPPHAVPQMAHQHQLPFHLQHGAHNMVPRHSPHVPPVQMHGGQHGPVPHTPYNGNDDHRMMHSNSTQSYSSPRMGQVPMAYPPNMNPPGQMPYNQPGMPSFMGPGQPPMNQYNRSFSNNGTYMPQQTPMMMPPQFMPQGMVAAPGQMMYPGNHPQFMPQGANPPQPMPGNNGYPSPGRGAAPMMVHQGSQQGQPLYGMSPGMHYNQPAFAPPQQGQMRGYPNNGPQQQYGTSPSQMHQYGPPHRNGNNFKGYQGNHNQHHQASQAGQHSTPSGPQTRNTDASDETK